MEHMNPSPTCPDSESVRRALLALSCLLPLLVQPGRAIAAPFEAGFLRQDPRQPGASALALGALSDEQQLPPGRYRVRLIVNLEDIGEHLLTFENDARTQTLEACLPRRSWVSWGCAWMHWRIRRPPASSAWTCRA